MGPFSLDPSLRDWLVGKLGGLGGELTALSVSKFICPDDPECASMVSDIINELDPYKLAWLVLQDMVTRKTYSTLDNLTLQERIFIRHLLVKFDSVLVDVDFNINDIWRKSGCKQLMNNK